MSNADIASLAADWPIAGPDGALRKVITLLRRRLTMTRTRPSRDGNAGSAPSAIVRSGPRQESCDSRPARSVIVLGGIADRTAFIDAIRAFAMIQRLGDGLTLHGYGPHRRSLEKWVSALRVDHRVTFGDQTAPTGVALAAHDIAIILSGAPGSDAASASISLAGPRIGSPGVPIARGDRIALIKALLAARSTDTRRANHVGDPIDSLADRRQSGHQPTL